jgi:hypothetical protein
VTYHVHDVTQVPDSDLTKAAKMLWPQIKSMLLPISSGIEKEQVQQAQEEMQACLDNAPPFRGYGLETDSLDVSVGVAECVRRRAEARAKREDEDEESKHKLKIKRNDLEVYREAKNDGLEGAVPFLAGGSLEDAQDILAYMKRRVRRDMAFQQTAKKILAELEDKQDDIREKLGDPALKILKEMLQAQAEQLGEPFLIDGRDWEEQDIGPARVMGGDG